MMLRRGLGLGLAVLVTAAATGCTPMTSAPRPTSAGPPPASSSSSAAAVTPAESTGVVTPIGTGVDTTTPSPAAQRVLARIPEPLTPAQQALNPVQGTSRTHGMAVAPAATYDSLQAAPVPSATQPLGAETSTVTMGETTGAAAAGAAPAAAAASPGAPAATGGPAAGGAAAAPASGSAAAATGAAATASGTAAGSAPAATGGPCWRVQVAAPLESDKEKADARLEAAQSLLVVAFTIVPEKGYLKIRTRDCMTREAADALKKRALDSGFDGSFLVDTNAPPPPHKKQQVPASKRKQ